MGVARPTDKEGTAFEQIVCYAQIWRGDACLTMGATLCHGGPHGEAPGLFRSVGGTVARAFNVFFVRRNQQGSISRLRMDYFEYF